MKTLPGLLIIALLFGISTAFAEVKDYSSTINTFRDSPALTKFFKNSYGYAVPHYREGRLCYRRILR
jgi:hypothetical protein